MRVNLLVTSICSCILLCFSASGIHIQFSRHFNFTDILYESNSTASCTNIPVGPKDIRGVITDTCVMVYYRRNCNSVRKGRLLPGKTEWLYPESFHECNENEGGPKLNIDLTTFSSGDTVKSAVLESHSDVCTCINVPHHIQMQKWSVNSHGNEFLAYFEPDCFESKWTPIYISAETSSDSWKIHKHVKTDSNTNLNYTVQSIGPVLNSTYFRTSCSYAKQSQFDLVNENVDSQLNELKRKQLDLETKITDYQNDIQTLLQKQVDLVEQLTNKHISEYTNLTMKIIQLDQAAEQRDRKLEKCQKNLQDVNTFYQKQSNDLSSNFSQLELKCNQLEKRLEDNQNYMDDQIEKFKEEMHDLFRQFTARFQEPI